MLFQGEGLTNDAVKGNILVPAMGTQQGSIHLFGMLNVPFSVTFIIKDKSDMMLF